MAPVRNAKVLFIAAPKGWYFLVPAAYCLVADLAGAGYPEPGKHMKYDDSETIDLESVPLKGGILAKTLLQSSDPYLRGRMYVPKPDVTYFVVSHILPTLIS